MNLHRINLVQTTFALVQAEAELFVARLFENLFRLDPCLCYLFPADMAAQKARFMAALAKIVGGLERPYPLIQQTLKPLGRKHAHLGIQPAHFHAFATALQHALADTLGSHFTPDVRQAWIDAYYLVVGVVKETAVPQGAINE